MDLLIGDIVDAEQFQSAPANKGGRNNEPRIDSRVVAAVSIRTRQ